MTKLATVKIVVCTVVGMSTSATVSQALRNAVPTETKAAKAQVLIGSTVAGAMAAEAARNYTDRFIDDIAAAFNSAKKTD